MKQRPRIYYSAEQKALIRAKSDLTLSERSSLNYHSDIVVFAGQQWD